MRSNEKSASLEGKSAKPERVVEGFSLVPFSVVNSSDGIINMAVQHAGGISTAIIDYFRYPDGRICVETNNTIYVLNSINPGFIKTHPAILKVLKNAEVRGSEIKEVLPQEKDFPVKATLNVWGLQRVKGSPENIGVVGRVVVHGDSGQTTPINRFWKCESGSVIIETDSGSFYKLGTPNLGFSVKNINLMTELGLM